jgi:hypothetical protein
MTAAKVFPGRGRRTMTLLTAWQNNPRQNWFVPSLSGLVKRASLSTGSWFDTTSKPGFKTGFEAGSGSNVAATHSRFVAISSWLGFSAHVFVATARKRRNKMATSPHLPLKDLRGKKAWRVASAREKEVFALFVFIL